MLLPFTVVFSCRCYRYKNLLAFGNVSVITFHHHGNHTMLVMACCVLMTHDHALITIMITPEPWLLISAKLKFWGDWTSILHEHHSLEEPSILVWPKWQLYSCYCNTILFINSRGRWTTATTVPSTVMLVNVIELYRDYVNALIDPVAVLLVLRAQLHMQTN